MRGYINALCRHGLDTGLILPEDEIWAYNSLLQVLELDESETGDPVDAPLHEVLDALTQNAVDRGVCDDNQVARDLFDTKLIGALTPPPREVRAIFRELYEQEPKKATDWYYAFSQNTNYIRRDRIAKDQKWQYESEYGTLDITSTSPSRRRTPAPLRRPSWHRRRVIPNARCVWRTKATPDG